MPFHLCKLVNQREVWKNNMHAVSTEYDFKLPSFPEILISIEDIFISFGSYIAHKRTQLKCWSISQPQSVVTQENNIKPNYEVNLRLQVTDYTRPSSIVKFETFPFEIELMQCSILTTNNEVYMLWYSGITLKHFSLTCFSMNHILLRPNVDPFST